MAVNVVLISSSSKNILKLLIYKYKRKLKYKTYIKNKINIKNIDIKENSCIEILKENEICNKSKNRRSVRPTLR